MAREELNPKWIELLPNELLLYYTSIKSLIWGI